MNERPAASDRAARTAALALATGLLALGPNVSPAQETSDVEMVFSLSELSAAGGRPAPASQTVPGTDGVELAYRAYVPDDPIAVLVFYHGGGAHSGSGYQHVGYGLRDSTRVAVYTPDIRGHGASGDERGDAPSQDQVWRDVSTLVDYVGQRHPGLPLFVGGHSSGAGLTLNYAGWDDRLPVEGWILLSPQLGFRSDTARKDAERSFVEVSIAPFVVNAMTGGWLFGHYRAVVFHYPPALLEADPGMVSSNTVNMSNAITPQLPQEQFRVLDRPFGLWIGERDELFVPEKVIAFAARVEAPSPGTVAEILAGANHLGILVTAHETIGPWIQGQVAALGRGPLAPAAPTPPPARR